MIYRIVHFFMFSLFLALGLQQITQPKGWMWLLVYGMAGALTLSALWKKIQWILPTALAFGAGFSAISLATELPPKMSLFEAKNGIHLLGLFIVSAWMGVLLFLNRAATVPVKRRPTK